MEYLDTPLERFRDLPDFPYEPSWTEVDSSGLKMAWVEAGPSDGPVVLLLHGEPSWSFLYRFMIPPLAEAGLRVVVPDLIGFGRSSKPTRMRDYTYKAHVGWMHRFVGALDLREVTLFGQDWGSLIGLRVAAEDSERFARIAIGNGFLPVGNMPKPKELPSLAAFLSWQTFARFSPVFVASQILNLGTARELSEQEKRAYDAPFPNKRYMAGARVFPKLVPLTPLDPARADNLAAWSELEKWTKPFLTLFSRGDPITRGLHKALERRIPGAAGQPHTQVRGGHFLQEDSGPELASRLVDFVERT